MLQNTCQDFLDQLASKAPVPGGGGAAAIAGAMGAALLQMVCNLTSGKPKYACYEEDIQRIEAKAEELRASLQNLVQLDAEVFEPLSAAYALPKDTPEQQAHKQAELERLLFQAALVPLQMVTTAAELVPLLEEAAQKGSKLLLSDVGVAAAMVEAALRSAALNVYVNTRLMQDSARIEKLNTLTEQTLAKALPQTAAVYADVATRLKG
ncbi:MAG: cyclodeaminase/cyclohydrolase family protein [Firmicutes bacterium]|nr:cyclodeaminase/cyclohydrolase family protein [Bacillota bacterium]MBQ3111359.1 cyclodeaminase/cyclohydrolase family protein [Bacillota bacterium]MBR6824547.1 cyclodeaminase/cyclohydrolase family protein [Bacillota bacterium]